MKITVSRIQPTSCGVIGKLYVDGDAGMFCYTLEDMVRECKIPGETAIPAGTYRVGITYSLRFKRPLPLLYAVPNFEGIRIHPGNTTEDTQGCILVGDELEGENIKGGTSRPAFNRLFQEIENSLQASEQVWITIENTFPV